MCTCTVGLTRRRGGSRSLQRTPALSRLVPYCSNDDCARLKKTNNNNGFRVRFGVRRRHRGPPFAQGYHQFIITGGNPGRRGMQKRVHWSGLMFPCVRPGSKKSMVGRDEFLNRTETRAELDRIEVRGGEHSKLTGQQTKKSDGHLPTEYQGQ